MERLHETLPMHRKMHNRQRAHQICRERMDRGPCRIREQERERETRARQYVAYRDRAYEQRNKRQQEHDAEHRMHDATLACTTCAYRT